MKKKKKTEVPKVLTTKEKRRRIGKKRKNASTGKSRSASHVQEKPQRKRRLQYHEEKAKRKLFKENDVLVRTDTNPLGDSSDHEFKSPAAKRTFKAIERASKNLPKTATKRLRVVRGIRKKATPKKKKLMKENLFVVSPNTKNQIEANKGVAEGFKKFFKKIKVESEETSGDENWNTKEVHR